MIATHIEERIADLIEHAEYLERRLRATGPDRRKDAQGQSRGMTFSQSTMYRYPRSAESSLERTLKLLQKMQAERQKCDGKGNEGGGEGKISGIEPKLAGEIAFKSNRDRKFHHDRGDGR